MIDTIFSLIFYVFDFVPVFYCTAFVLVASIFGIISHFVSGKPIMR